MTLGLDHGALDLAPHMEAVARHFWGDPNPAHSSKGELRWGSHGSRSVDLTKGVWFDHEAGEGGGVLDFVVREAGCANQRQAADCLRQLGLALPEPVSVSKEPLPQRTVANYIYTDAEGAPVLRVTRYEPKGFSQSRPNGAGWSAGGISEATKVPYRLPEIIEAMGQGAIVYVVEGEKAADALAAQGLAATCSPGGSGKWPAHFAQWFAGAQVIVLPDNDKAGADHAAQVAENLRSVAASLRIVELPGLPPKGDAFDWLKAGGKADSIVGLGVKRRGLTAADLQGMDFSPIKFVVDGYITEGLTILAGKPKLGKSWLVLDICNAVAKGGFTLGDTKCVEGDVLYLALEDNPRRMKSRMAAVCPLARWPARLTFWHADDMPRLDDGGLEALREWIRAQPNPRLIAIDTLKFVRPLKRKDEDSYAYDYRSITPIKALADEFGIAIVVVHHTRKMGADDQLEAVSGTNGLTGAADTILVLNRGSEGVTLYGRGRDIEEIETAVRFERDTCRWSVLGEAAEVRRSDERQKILGTLREDGGQMAPSVIASVTGLKSGNVRALLTKMAKAGEVMKHGYGKYSLPSISPRCTDNTGNTSGDGHA